MKKPKQSSVIVIETSEVRYMVFLAVAAGVLIGSLIQYVMSGSK